MEQKKLNISDEVLQNLSLEELVDLKLEIDELLLKVNETLETCKTTLNS